MSKVLKSRLKMLVAASGKSVRELSMAATGKPDAIRDILRDKVKNPRSDTISNLAKALGTTAAYLTGETKNEQPGGEEKGSGIVAARVVGSAQAGAFIEVDTTVFEVEPRYIGTVRDESFPDIQPVAFEVIGDSIDKICQSGGYAICVPFGETGLQIKAGLWVVAERRRGDLVERTIKVVRRTISGSFQLQPYSTNPAHKPITFPSAEPSEEVVIVAVVRRFQTPPLPLEEHLAPPRMDAAHNHTLSRLREKSR